MLSEPEATSLDRGRRNIRSGIQEIMGKVWGSLVMMGALAVASPAMAATVVFNSGGTNATTSSKSFTGSDGTQVRVTAFSIDGTGTIVGGTLGQYSGGIGVQAANDTSHTTDNINSKDFFLLSFSTYVTVGNATFTTNFNFNNGSCCLGDTDATVGAGILGLPWASNLSGFIGQNQSVLSGLGLYSSDSSSTASTQTRNINPSGLGGTLWLVGASFTDTTPEDGFKFKSLNYNAVPEPSTWALLILGFGGVGAAMRKRKQPALAIA